MFNLRLGLMSGGNRGIPGRADLLLYAKSPGMIDSIGVSIRTNQGDMTLNAIDYVPMAVMAGDSEYLYGQNAPGGVLLRQSSKDSFPQTAHNFGAGVAIDTVIVSTDNILFVSLKTTTSSKYNLYKSVDNGVSFGNNENCDNGLPVLMFGNTDGTEPNQIPKVATLSDRSFAVAPDGRYLIGEYNFASGRVPGGANDQVRLLSSADNGTTWTEVAHWNTDGLVNNVTHIHSVRVDKYTGNIYILFGEAASGMIRWNGSSSLVSNTHPENYTDYEANGSFGLGNLGRYCYCDLLFTDNYMFGFADTVNAGERGIWRIAKDLSSFTKINSDVESHNYHAGFFGVKTRAGHLIFGELTEASATDKVVYIYASYDGGSSFDIVGRYGQRSPGGCLCFFEWSKDNNIYICYAGTGKGDYGTAVINPSTGVARELPEIIHPVYWISPQGVDGVAPLGHTSSTPWLTPEYALQSDRITHGARVILREGVYNLANGIIADFNGNTRSGNPSDDVIIEGAGKTHTRIHYETGARSTAINLDTAVGSSKVIVKSLRLTSNKASGNICAAYAGGGMKFIDSIVGDEFGNHGIAIRAFNSFELNNTIVASNKAIDSYNILTGLGATNVAIKITNSILIGGTNSILLNNISDSIEVNNSNIIDYSNFGVTLTKLLATLPDIKNTIIYSEMSGSIAYNNGGGNPDTNVHHICYTGTVYGLTSSPSNIIGSPLFANYTNRDFRLQPTSPCIAAGTNPFADGDGDQYDADGYKVWDDTYDLPDGHWIDGVDIGAYAYGGGDKIYLNLIYEEAEEKWYLPSAPQLIAALGLDSDWFDANGLGVQYTLAEWEAFEGPQVFGSEERGVVAVYVDEQVSPILEKCNKYFNVT